MPLFDGTDNSPQSDLNLPTSFQNDVTNLDKL